MTLLLSSMWRNFLPFPSFWLNFTSHRALQTVLTVMWSEIRQNLSNSAWYDWQLYETFLTFLFPFSVFYYIFIPEDWRDRGSCGSLLCWYHIQYSKSCFEIRIPKVHQKESERKFRNSSWRLVKSISFFFIPESSFSRLIQEMLNKFVNF